MQQRRAARAAGERGEETLLGFLQCEVLTLLQTLGPLKLGLGVSQKAARLAPSFSVHFLSQSRT